MRIIQKKSHIQISIDNFQLKKYKEQDNNVYRRQAITDLSWKDSSLVINSSHRLSREVPKAK